MTDGLDIAVRARAKLGEGPTWDIRTGTLIWVDVLAPQIHRWDPERGVDECAPAPQHVGAAKPRAGGGLVLNLRDGVALQDTNGEHRWLVYWARDGVRGNDAGVDGAGRLWAGTMRYDSAENGGWLARVQPDGAAKVMLDEVTVSNGIGWSPDNTRMYYADTPTGRVDVFDFDVSTGEATARRSLVATSGESPDGLCVDADGCVWVAFWEGGQVRRYTPDGVLDRTITLPVSRTTACCFGGTGLTDLYITTASADAADDEPLAGSLFVVPDIGAGLPSPMFAG